VELPSSHLEKLIYVPERHRVAETFGWQPGIWGVFFIVATCVYMPFVNDSASDHISWLFFGSLAVLGLGLTGYEIWRRRNRTVLVKDGEYILVFRKGRLDLTLARSKITRIKADFHTMLWIGAPMAVCAALLTAVGITSILRDKTGSTDGLLILFWGIVCWVSLASAAWTRFYTCHLRVPVRGSKWTEESVLIPSYRFKELFP
jgi:hypothetical protein